MRSSTPASADLRVRLAKFPAVPPTPTEHPPLRARQIKTRTGCQQCKKRRLKCDETRPICRRCQVRGEDCSGAVEVEQWQTIVLAPIPRITHISRPPRYEFGDDELLQYFANVILKDMVIEVHTATPLPQALDPHIRSSKALMHAAKSLSQAHLFRFQPGNIHRLLKGYNRTLTSLREEVERETVERFRSRNALHRLLLGTLFLAVLQAWFDDSGSGCGVLHLRGAHATVDLLLASSSCGEPLSALEYYLIGSVAHIDMLCSFLIPAQHPLPQGARLLNELQKDRWRSGAHMHPISGLSTSLDVLVGQAGRYYRSVVDLRVRDLEKERDLERCLLQWKPLDADGKPVHVQIADGYRLCGLLMLQQARRVNVRNPPSDAQSGPNKKLIFQLASYALAILRDTPRVFPQVYFETPMLLIVGPEIEKEDQAGRHLIDERFTMLANHTSRRGHRLAAEFVREFWQIRDNGRNVTWLELMVEKGLLLNLT